LTYNGDSSFKTSPGAVISLIVLLAMVAFSSYKFSVFVNRQDPDVSRQTFLRNLDEKDEELTPSKFGLELAFGIGKPLPPEYGSLRANIVTFDYEDDDKSRKNATVSRKRNKDKKKVNMIPCGLDYFKGF
jgi:hypothetical protein